LAEQVWVGTHGSAKVRSGDVLEAITSDGTRHAL